MLPGHDFARENIFVNWEVAAPTTDLGLLDVVVCMLRFCKIFPYAMLPPQRISLTRLIYEKIK
jgi:hypothetical protein